MVRFTVNIIFIATLLISSCSSSKKNGTSTTVNPLILKVRTTACYGMCPVYEATISSNYIIRIKPKKFCSFDTIIQRHLYKNEQEELSKLLSAIQLDTIKESYIDTLLMDAPTIYYTFYSKTDSVTTMMNTSTPEPIHNHYLFVNDIFKQMSKIKR